MQQSSETDLLSSLPDDISFKIASSLQARDVCALGSCSRFWRDVCRSESLWASLTHDRWPSLSSSASDPTVEGWKDIYRRTHRDMARRAVVVIESVELSSFPCHSLEIGDYFRLIEVLRSAHLSFKDVELFIFKPNLSVLLNLVGFHYCFFHLKVPARDVMDALVRCEISERQVCVKWWKLGRWFYGFRMRDESHSRWVSLADFVTKKGEEVLGVLRRGAIHEVLRVEITTNSTPSSWRYQIMQ